ncbi:hypothetical protein MDAP_001211 [Mitosporidium daphniae]
MSASGNIITKGLHSSFSQQHVLPHNILKVYSCVSDVQKYSEFIPGIKRSRIISFSNISDNPSCSSIIGQTNPVPTVTFAELQIDVIAIQLRYISRVIGIPYQSIEAKCLNSTIFNNLHTRWQFTPNSDSETLVDFRVEFEFANSVYGTTLYPIFSKMAQLTIKSFEKRLSTI